MCGREREWMEGEEWRVWTEAEGRGRRKEQIRKRGEKRAILCPTRCYINTTPIRHIKCVALCTCYTCISSDHTPLISPYISLNTQWRHTDLVRLVRLVVVKVHSYNELVHSLHTSHLGGGGTRGGL